MTVRELINELLHTDMDAYIEIAYNELTRSADKKVEESIEAVRSDDTGSVVYLCGRARVRDFEPL